MKRTTKAEVDDRVEGLLLQRKEWTPRDVAAELAHALGAYLAAPTDDAARSFAARIAALGILAMEGE